MSITPRHDLEPGSDERGDYSRRPDPILDRQMKIGRTDRPASPTPNAKVPSSTRTVLWQLAALGFAIAAVLGLLNVNNVSFNRIGGSMAILALLMPLSRLRAVRKGKARITSGQKSAMIALSIAAVPVLFIGFSGGIDVIKDRTSAPIGTVNQQPTGTSPEVPSGNGNNPADDLATCGGKVQSASWVSDDFATSADIIIRHTLSVLVDAGRYAKQHNGSPQWLDQCYYNAGGSFLGKFSGTAVQPYLPHIVSATYDPQSLNQREITPGQFIFMGYRITVTLDTGDPFSYYTTQGVRWYGDKWKVDFDATS